MSSRADRLEQTALRAQIADLERELERARRVIHALVGEKIDAIVSPAATEPLLLQQAREELRRSELLLRAIFEGSVDALLFTDHVGAILEANPAACALFGRDRDGLLGTTTAELAAPAPGLDAAGERGTMRLTRPSGEERLIEYTIRRVLEGCSVSVLRDVTDRVRADREKRSAAEELQRTSQLLESIVAAAPHGIAVLDTDGQLRLWNPAAERITGWSREELNPPVPHAATDAEWRALLASVCAAKRRDYVALRRLGKNGQVVDLLLSQAPLLESGAAVGAVLVFADLTETRHLEAQLREAQKMEAVGLLAGGVAHDFNNMLAAIRGFAGLLRSDLAEHDPLRSDVDEILAASERAASLTGQLLAVSRRQPIKLAPMDLCSIVAGMERMLERVMGEDIEVCTFFTSCPATVRGARTQLEQILLNLAVNARDAMPRGGSLMIELEPIIVRTQAKEAPAKRYVGLTVIDTGVGMDEETRSRVFEPFFTTKDLGRGTGLGLATVYGIVKQLGGTIDIDSELGRGTSVRILFPRTDDEPAPMEAPRPKVLRPRGTECVLVVEDEPAVRRMLVHLLSRHGYRVLHAANAGEALLIAEEFGASIDLLLTDVVLPRRSGLELAERLQSDHPRLRVIYVTGYMVTSEAILSGEVVTKPFDPAVLLERIRAVLDAPGVPAPGAR